jgi:DNA-binding LacI/PurR family transcriptional regulator
MRTRRIVFLSPLGLKELPSQPLFVYGELARRLAPLDATIQLATSGAFTHRHVARYLDQLAAGLCADGWVLHRAPAEVQHYFQERSLPAVLNGNAHEGIDLPALQVDYPAALRHCVAMLGRLGHAPEAIALLLPDTELAGHFELERAFRELTGPRAPGGAPAGNVIRHHEQGDNLLSLLAHVLGRKARPTAFVVLRTSIAAALHGLLPFRFGLAVPRQASLACLEDVPFMKHLVPGISRYRIDNGKVVRLIFSSLSRRLSSGLGQSWRHRPLIPEFIPGETLAPPPRLARTPK